MRTIIKETLSEKFASWLCVQLYLRCVGNASNWCWLASALYWLLLASLPVPRGTDRPQWMSRTECLQEARDDLRNWWHKAPREWD